MFDEQRAKLFTTYSVALRFREKVYGGVPKNPRVMLDWIKKGTGLSDPEELQRMVLRTMRQMGYEPPDNVTDRTGPEWEAWLDQVSAMMAVERNANGLKFDEHGPYLETRQIEACLQEAVNILYAGTRWVLPGTKTGGKSPKSLFSETTFIRGLLADAPSRVHLGVPAPAGIDLQIVHATGPQGPRS